MTPLRAVALTVLVAAAVAAYVLVRDDGTRRIDGPVNEIRLLRVQPVEDDTVRVVTDEGGCEHSQWVQVLEREASVEINVLGDAVPPSASCPAMSVSRCIDVDLGRPLGGRRLLPAPVVPPDLAAEARRTAAGRTECERLPYG